MIHSPFSHWREHEGRLIHNVFGGGEVPVPDSQIRAQIGGNEIGEKTQTQKKTVESQKQLMEAARKSPEAAQKSVIDQIWSRLKQFGAVLNGQRETVASTNKRRQEFTQQTEESLKSFRAREMQNKFTDSVANMSQALTGIGLLGPMERTQTRRQMVTKRAPDTGGDASNEDQAKKKAVEQPAKQEVAAAQEQKGKADAQPGAKLEVEAGKTKAAQQQLAAEAGVKESQQGMAT